MDLERNSEEEEEEEVDPVNCGESVIVDETLPCNEDVCAGKLTAVILILRKLNASNQHSGRSGLSTWKYQFSYDH